MQSFISTTLEVAGAVGILYAYLTLCIFCPWFLAITFFIIAIFIWDYLRTKDFTNNNFDNQL